MILYLSETRETNVKDCLKDYCKKKKLNISEEETEKLEIIRNKYGKPSLLNNATDKTGGTEIHFSVSHSGTYYVCLIGEEEIGIDIEDVKQRIRGNLRANADEMNLSEEQIIEMNKAKYEALAKRFFTPREYDYVKADGPLGFVKIWIRKEAYVKYLGTGLAQGLDTFEVIGEGGRFKSCVDELFLSEVDFQSLNDAGFNPKGFKYLSGAYCSKNKVELEEIVKI